MPTIASDASEGTSRQKRARWRARRGSNPRPPDSKRPDHRAPLTFSTFLSEFRARYAALQPNPEGYEDNLRVLERHFGFLLLDAIDVRAIGDFIAARLAEGVCRGTINRQRATLSRVLGTAVEWGYLASNPARRVRPFKEAPGRVRYLSGGEAAALVAAIRTDLRPLLLFLLHTGCRRGEALALTWGDVDLANRRARFAHTKNGDARVVPLSNTLLTVLTGLRGAIDARVFTVGPAGLRRPWRAALKAAGIRNFRMHDLRHTAASLMAQAGVPLQQIADVLGHRSFSMTRRYAHLAPEHLSSAVNAIDAAAVWGGCKEERS